MVNKKEEKKHHDHPHWFIVFFSHFSAGKIVPQKLFRFFNEVVFMPH